MSKGSSSRLQATRVLAVLIVAGLVFSTVFAAMAFGQSASDVVLSAVAKAVDGVGGFTNLDQVYAVATFEVGDNTYAVAASNGAEGIQIVNVTDPSNPVAAGYLADGDYTALRGLWEVDIFEMGDNTYAVAASRSEAGIQIVNITDPFNPAGVGFLANYLSGNDPSIWAMSSDTAALGGANDVSVFRTGSGTYAAVASYTDNALQIVNITDLANPAAAGRLTGSPDTILYAPSGVDTFRIGSDTYAAVTEYYGDAVLVVNVTDPSNPVAAGRLANSIDTRLSGAWAVDVFYMGAGTYAAVGSYYNNGLQIVDVTDPLNPVAAGDVNVRGARGVDIFRSGAGTYAAVVSYYDNALHVADITDPYNPSAAGYLADGPTTALVGAWDVDTFRTGTDTYAAVAAYYDNALQIISLGLSPHDHHTAPVLDYVGARSISEGSALEFTLGTANATADHTYSMSNAPSGATLNQTSGAFSWTPTEAQGPNSYNVTFTVHDGQGDADSQTVYITVDEVNAPPTLRDIGNMTVNEGLPLEFAVNATDGDIPANGLTYAAAGLPEGAAWDPSVRTLSWTPTEAQGPGTYNVTFTVHDGQGGADSQTVAITVDEVNDPPALQAIGDRTVDEGSELTFTVNGTDGDIPANGLTYAASGLPDGAAWDPSVRTLSWTPTEAQGPGTYRLNFTVSDGAGGADSQAVSITVQEVNQPPVLGTIGNRTVDEGSALSFTVNATDEDLPANDLSYAASGLPDGAAWDPSVSTFSWTPTERQGPATYHVNFTVSDGAGGADSQTVYITVDEVNDPPVAGAGADRTASAGEAVILAGTASDPDDDPLTYVWMQTAGSPTVTLANRDTLSPSFTAPRLAANTTLAFSLTVGDGLHNSTDTVEVGVRGVPEISHFVTVWRTAVPGESITIPVGGSSGAYTVDWGDGTVSEDVSGDQTHSYNDAGTHTVRIYGDFERIYLEGDTRNAAKLRSIEQWGDIRWASMGHAFSWASNMVYRATDTPDLSGVTDMSSMFSRASSFNGDISAWDVSSVTDMSGMFVDASSFNQPLNDWDVSSVTAMPYMFSRASSFNQPISAWDVSSVTDMRGMFYQASSFNQPISAWDVSAVADMFHMFWGASSFNQPISSWDVSSVTDMSGMFWGASSFNQPISAWVVSSVTDMHAMFYQASSFNQPLNAWDVSQVTDMHAMFYQASSFNQPISAWDVSQVTDMHAMFYRASSFNQPLSPWDVSSVTDMHYMFLGASSFNQPISAWDVSSVADMHAMFYRASSFNQPLSPWDVSSVTDMSHMFHQADGFNQNLGGWYIVLDDAAIDYDDIPGAVGSISARNAYLDRQNPVYGIGTGGDSASFSMDGADLVLDIVPTKRTYAVNITSTGDFGTNNHLVLEISVTGSSPNRAPTAEAGPDQAVDSGAAVTLDGTGSSDPDSGDSISYSWSQTSGTTVTLSNSSAVSPTFTAPDGPAVLAFELGVTDTGFLSSTDTVNVAVAAPPNRMPVADAGPDQAVQSGLTVTLDGTGSSDPDSGDSISYSWSQTSGTTVTLSNSSAVSPTFTAPDGPAVLAFELDVTDTGSLSSTDTVNVTVAAPPNRMPVADAGPDQTVASGAAVTLDGTGSSDPDTGDTIASYSWYQTSGTTVDLSNSTVPSPTFTAPAGPAVLVFELRAADQGGLTSTDTVNVTVAAPPNRMPVADAGDDQAVQSGQTVTLDGTGSSDPDAGDALSYMWSQTSGNTVTLSSSTVSSPTFTAPAGPALLAFLLNVTDGSLSSTDAVYVNVTAPANVPPVLGQIGNMTINERSKLSFMVSAADGNPGDAVTYSVSGAPPGAAFDTATGKFSWTPAEAQGPGSYVVTFGATDGLDAAEPRTTTITVNEVNQAPRFGSSLVEGYNCNAAVNGTVTLDFAVTDPDLPVQALAVDDSSYGDIAYSAAVTDGALKFSATIAETDGQQFPYDHRLLFYIVVADGHDPPGTDTVAIRIYLPAAGEPQWPAC